ncbi:MAG: hypothetical protein AAGI52_12375 [Bacteroidota bacterium]
MTDRTAHLLNGLLLLATGFLIASEGLPDDGYILLVLLMVAAPIASSLRIWQRARAMKQHDRLAPVDELDPVRLLDLDARLEALERRERETLRHEHYRS